MSILLFSEEKYLEMQQRVKPVHKNFIWYLSCQVWFVSYDFHSLWNNRVFSMNYLNEKYWIIVVAHVKYREKRSLILWSWFFPSLNTSLLPVLVMILFAKQKSKSLITQDSQKNTVRPWIWKRVIHAPVLEGKYLKQGCERLRVENK